MDIDCTQPTDPHATEPHFVLFVRFFGVVFVILDTDDALLTMA
jgi:hypothetical protein